MATSVQEVVNDNAITSMTDTIRWMELAIVDAMNEFDSCNYTNDRSGAKRQQIMAYIDNKKQARDTVQSDIDALNGQTVATNNSILSYFVPVPTEAQDMVHITPVHVEMEESDEDEDTNLVDAGDQIDTANKRNQKPDLADQFKIFYEYWSMPTDTLKDRDNSQKYLRVKYNIKNDMLKEFLSETHRGYKFDEELEIIHAYESQLSIKARLPTKAAESAFHKRLIKQLVHMFKKTTGGRGTYKKIKAIIKPSNVLLLRKEAALDARRKRLNEPVSLLGSVIVDVPDS
jgi:hypothetical protein